MDRLKRISGALALALMIIVFSFGVSWLVANGKGLFLVGILIGFFISDVWKLFK